MKKLLCFVVVLLLALTVFVACGDADTTEKPDTTTTPAVTTTADGGDTTTAAKPDDTTAAKPDDTTAAKPDDTTAAKPVDTTAEKPVDTTAEKPVDTAAPDPFVTLPEGLADAKVKSDSVSAEGITIWGDAPATKLFDNDTVGTKICGGTNKADVTVLFSTSKAITATYYTIYTGGDSATWTGRNPLGWTLYGKVGEEWVVLSALTETGLKDVDSTPFSYEIKEPKACSEYKIVFKTGDSMQLNEIKLHYVPAEGEDPDAEKDERSKYLTVGEMKEITANGTGCAFNVHENFCTLQADNKLEIGFASAGQFSGDATATLKTLKLAKIYLNGEELEVTDGMFSTAEHWKLYFQLDPAKLVDGENEVIVKIVPGPDSTGCNFESYYGIYTFTK